MKKEEESNSRTVLPLAAADKDLEQSVGSNNQTHRLISKQRKQQQLRRHSSPLTALQSPIISAPPVFKSSRGAEDI
jgi:hypothetical protein